jgi:hypothetical protein
VRSTLLTVSKVDYLYFYEDVKLSIIFRMLSLIFDLYAFCICSPEELVLDGRFKELPLFKSDGLKFFDIRPIGNEPSPVYKWIQFNRYLTEHAKVS